MRSRLFTVLALLLGGCVPTSFYVQQMPFDVQADQFNVAAAQTERLMIVRNVMRARDRTSMIFTRVSGFHASMQRTLSGTATFTQAPQVNNQRFAPGVTVSGQATPSFDMTVLDDERFHRAIETSIDLGVYQMLLQGGWRANLLHTLFIDRIVADGRDYENDPASPAGYAAFQQLLRSHPGGLQICTKSETHAFGPPLAASGHTDLQGLAAVAGQHLQMTQDDHNAWRLSRSDVTRWFAFDCNDPGQAFASVRVELPGQESRSDTSLSVHYVSSGLHGQSVGESRDDNRVYVRSIEGVLFYLGEIVRAEQRAHPDDDHPLTVGIDPDGSGHVYEQALFVVHRAANGHPEGIVFQHEDGQTYYVPYPPLTAGRGNQDRTHQVISLLIQLIGMLQQQDEIPSTQSVRVVN
jgi:hypothetical protein